MTNAIVVICHRKLSDNSARQSILIVHGLEVFGGLKGQALFV